MKVNGAILCFITFLQLNVRSTDKTLRPMSFLFFLVLKRKPVWHINFSERRISCADPEGVVRQTFQKRPGREILRPMSFLFFFSAQTKTCLALKKNKNASPTDRRF
jgi:hypothetical protein